MEGSRSKWLRVACCGLWIAGCGFRVACDVLRAAECELGVHQTGAGLKAQGSRRKAIEFILNAGCRIDDGGCECARIKGLGLRRKRKTSFTLRLAP